MSPQLHAPAFSAARNCITRTAPPDLNTRGLTQGRHCHRDEGRRRRHVRLVQPLPALDHIADMAVTLHTSYLIPCQQPVHMQHWTPMTLFCMTPQVYRRWALPDPASLWGPQHPRLIPRTLSIPLCLPLIKLCKSDCVSWQVGLWLVRRYKGKVVDLGLRGAKF